MKILKEGTAPPTATATCDHCGAEVEFFLSEALEMSIPGKPRWFFRPDILGKVRGCNGTIHHRVLFASPQRPEPIGVGAL